MSKRPSIQKLYEKLLGEKDFGRTWTYFLDNFGDRPEFLASSEVVKNEGPVYSMLVTVVKAIQSSSLSNVIIRERADLDFCFGAFFTGPREPGGFFYFKERDYGMVTVLDNKGQGQAKFARVSQRLTNGMRPTPNPMLN